MTPSTPLAQALTRLRESRGLSLRAAARRAGMRPQRWASYEAGFVEPKQRSIERILDALEAGPTELARTLELQDAGRAAAKVGLHEELHGLLARFLELLVRVLEAPAPGAPSSRRDEPSEAQEARR